MELQGLEFSGVVACGNCSWGFFFFPGGENKLVNMSFIATPSITSAMIRCLLALITMHYYPNTSFEGGWRMHERAVTKIAETEVNSSLQQDARFPGR